MSRAARRRKRPLPRRGNSVPVFHGAGFCVTREFPACRDVARRGQDTRPTNLRNLQTKTANRKFPSGRGILRDPQLPHLPERPHPKEPWDFAWPANFPPAGTLSGAVKTRALQIHGICEQKQQIANSRPVVGRGLDPAVGFCVTRKFPACRTLPGAVKTRALQICGICKQKRQIANSRQAVGFCAARKFPACRDVVRRGQDARPTNPRNCERKR